jgi:hypothetical protein
MAHSRGFSAAVASLILLSSLTSLAVSAAEQLYRWTDEQGRTHFSDRAPPSDAAETVEALATPTYSDPGIPSDQYSVVEQWRRLSAERQAEKAARQEREDRRREYALRQREIAAAEQAAAQITAVPTYGGPVWVAPPRYRPGHRPGHHPGNRPLKPQVHRPAYGLWKPEHPAFSPRPGYGGRIGRHGPGFRAGF